MLDEPRILEELKTVNFEIKLHHPWIILVRVCALSISPPFKVKNVRIRKIDQDTVLIAWNDIEYMDYKRCIQTYEIYYTRHIDEDTEQWRSITPNEHIPFLSYFYHISEPNQHLQGILISIEFLVDADHKLFYQYLLFLYRIL